MPLTLYATRRSRATRPIWLAEEAGFDLPIVPVWQAHRVDTAEPGLLTTDSPEFRELSPQGSVPVLRDGPFVIAESLAITMHLARVLGGAFGPADEAENGRMLHWLFFAATEIEPDAVGLIMGQGDAAAHVAALRRPFATLEAHLARRDWLVGDRLTAADIGAIEICRYATGTPEAFAPFPRVADWVARGRARPAYQRMWAAREAEPERLTATRVA